MESALLRAYTLIETTVSSHRRQAAQTPEPLQGAVASGAVAVVERLIGGAQRSVGALLREPGAHTDAVCAALSCLSGRQSEGLAVRLLCAPRVLESEALVRLLHGGRAAARPEVRVMVEPTEETLIADGRAAAVQDPERPAGGTLGLLHDPAMVRVIESLFACVWSSAVPLEGYNRLGGRARTASIRRTLSHLGTGVTDDVAAREMGVSLRTYRRHVAEIMRALGADSRFQAGARAVELGLMPGSVESRADRPQAQAS